MKPSSIMSAEQCAGGHLEAVVGLPRLARAGGPAASSLVCAIALSRWHASHAVSRKQVSKPLWYSVGVDTHGVGARCEWSWSSRT